MKLHYLSCHSVLEYDECKLFSEMGIDVYSNGAYRDPKGAYTLPRPGISTMKFNQQFFDLTARFPQTELPPELIEPYDAFMVMHSPEVLIANWPRIKHKRVIWRSIGQSVPSIEQRLKPLVEEGLQIVRYSVKEKKLDNFAGMDALIPFYKDPKEYNGWLGETDEVVNFSQSLLGRRYFCHYDEIMAVGAGFNFKVYGVGNNDLGPLNGGELPFDLQKGKLRDARCLVYGGTWPACYTLTLIEAMMTGLPVVAIGKGLAESDRFEKLDFYEVNEIIKNGENGFISDDIEELRESVKRLTEDHELAARIGKAGRETAIKLFGRDVVQAKWRAFLQL